MTIEILKVLTELVAHGSNMSKPYLETMCAEIGDFNAISSLIRVRSFGVAKSTIWLKSSLSENLENLVQLIKADTLSKDDICEVIQKILR